MDVIDDKLDAALEDEHEVVEPSEAAAEVDVSKVTKQGLVEVFGGQKKEKKGKDVWLCLVSGTLFWYRSSKLKALKGDIQLKGTTLRTSGKDIYIDNGEKCQLMLRFQADSAVAEWASLLATATKREPAPPPSRIKNKGPGASMRAKKSIVGKVATSTLGKAVGRVTINDESKQLINCVKNLTASQYDIKTANSIENNIIKLFVKSHFLASNGQLEDEWWLALDTSLREAFKVAVRICDNIQSGRIIPQDILEEWIQSIVVSLRHVESQLFKLLQPFLQPKSLARIGDCFEVFASEAFLKATLVDQTETTKKDSEELLYAMERYLQFNW
jgi:hypothetical protein